MLQAYRNHSIYSIFRSVPYFLHASCRINLQVGATPAPWGGYGPTLWAQGPVSGVNTSAPYCWILGGSDTNSAHNQMTLFTNGAHTLLTGSSTSTTTAPSSASDPGGRVTAGRWTFNNRMYIFGGSRLYDTNDMWHFDGTGWTLVVETIHLSQKTKILE